MTGEQNGLGKAGETDNSGAAQGAGDCTGPEITVAAGEAIGWTNAHGTYITFWNSGTSALNHILPPGAVLLARTTSSMVPPLHWSYSAFPVGQALPPPPHEGIVVGEIMAWRAWRCQGDKLMSYSASYEWPADQPAKGDPSQEWQGIHALKARAQVEKQGGALMAIGRVRLWGEVTEHETGYRAEYGRAEEIVSFPKRLGTAPVSDLDRQYLTYDAEAICKRYGLKMPREELAIVKEFRRAPVLAPIQAVAIVVWSASFAVAVAVASLVMMTFS